MRYSTEHSIIYEDFVRDLCSDEYPTSWYPNEYNGESVMRLGCSQHKEFMSDKKQKVFTQAAFNEVACFLFSLADRQIGVVVI